MYRSTGFIAFVLRRRGGPGDHLLLHMSSAASTAARRLNDRMEFLGKPFFRLLEIGLLAAVISRRDGIRLLIGHYFQVTEYRRGLFYAVIVVSGILVIAGGCRSCCSRWVRGGGHAIFRCGGARGAARLPDAHMVVVHYPPGHIDVSRVLERLDDPLWKAVDIASWSRC